MPRNSEAIELRSADLAVRVEALGARIDSIVVLASDTELLLHTPWADEEFDSFHRMTPTGDEWHRRYAGGWHPVLPHAGEDIAQDGVVHAFHGEAGWRTWRTIVKEPQRCTQQVMLRTVPLLVDRTVTVEQNRVTVLQRATNYGAEPTSVTWGEHPAFGPALISAQTTIRVSGRPITLTMPEDGGRLAAITDVDDVGRGQYELCNPASGLAVSVTFDPELFRHLWIWQEHHGTSGFPWWGAVNTIGVEPFSRSFVGDESGLGSVRIAPGQSRETTVTLTVSAAT